MLPRVMPPARIAAYLLLSLPLSRGGYGDDDPGTDGTAVQYVHSENHRLLNHRTNVQCVAFVDTSSPEFGSLVLPKLHKAAKALGEQGGGHKGHWFAARALVVYVAANDEENLPVLERFGVTGRREELPLLTVVEIDNSGLEVYRYKGKRAVVRVPGSGVKSCDADAKKAGQEPPPPPPPHDKKEEESAALEWEEPGALEWEEAPQWEAPPPDPKVPAIGQETIRYLSTMQTRRAVVKHATTKPSPQPPPPPPPPPPAHPPPPPKPKPPQPPKSCQNRPDYDCEGLASFCFDGRHPAAFHDKDCCLTCWRFRPGNEQLRDNADSDEDLLWSDAHASDSDAGGESRNHQALAETSLDAAIVGLIEVFERGKLPRHLRSSAPSTPFSARLAR